MTHSTETGPDTLITLFGRPGSGKTTVGDALQEQGYRHLAMGRLLRDPTILADIGIDREEMKAAIASGRTIRNANLYPWLDKQIAKFPGSVIVDGYPRVASAVDSFNYLASTLLPKTTVIALHLRCPAEQAGQRVSRRGRDDDRAVDLADRNDEYDREQAPLIDLLSPSVMRIDIDASSDKAEVINAVLEAVEAIRRNYLGHKA